MAMVPEQMAAAKKLTDEQLAATIADVRLLIERAHEKRDEAGYLALAEQWTTLCLEQEVRRIAREADV